ncbi:MAG: alanine--tRNA ligase [Planctomycetota bacterium]
MKSAEIRSRYLDFFARHGHTIYKSASLVPENDPTLLFTGAGMNQFKDMFLGRGNLPFTRATTSQKCLRLPDLENVGRTPSHHTFFEMLGNFSFGDYFKKEAIAWAQEFLVEELGLPRDSLYYSVYTEDDEAARLWVSEAGVEESRVFRYGEKDNFWPAEAPSKGPNGPCGPCSEIYYDFRPGEPVGKEGPAADGQRFVEVWNLVFTQYDRRDGGVLVDLPRRNIDTGAGFERLVRVMQGGATNFDTDLFLPLLQHVAEVTGKRYGDHEADNIRMRRIADHVRAVVFCVGDGVLPSNERQGYVVRKILRRALVDWWTLGAKERGIETLVPVVTEIEGMAEVYPELLEHRDRAIQVIADESQRFAGAYTTGSSKLADHIAMLERDGQRVLEGAKAFYLWDTVGLPLDITRRILRDRGLDVDEKGFEEAMEEQRERGRRGSKMDGSIFDAGPVAQLKGRIPPTEFTGYTSHAEAVRVKAILLEKGLSPRAASGAAAALVLDRSPFYAEAGGQVGDRGHIAGDTFTFAVTRTAVVDGYHLHEGEVTEGTVQVDDPARALIDVEGHREPTMRNHTATHLLHWALRRVVGRECEQAGSLVAPDRLRFDFRCPRAPTAEELARVEQLVNEQILKNIEVAWRVTGLQEARSSGAMALFGEKYGERVRVVSIVDPDAERTSIELCAGTHCRRTGDIGLFKILSEGSIAAGVRRIEAVTGLGALAHFACTMAVLQQTARVLKIDAEALPERVEALQAEVRSLRKELDAARAGDALAVLDTLRQRGRHSVGEAFVYAGVVAGQDQKGLMALADHLLGDEAERPLAAVLAGGGAGGEIPLVVACNGALVERGVKAGDLCRDLSRRLGGGGGGNPRMARGQGRGDPAAFDAALHEVLSGLAARLGGSGGPQ